MELTIETTNVYDVITEQLLTKEDKNDEKLNLLVE
jgi:hypothetical protein